MSIYEFAQDSTQTHQRKYETKTPPDEKDVVHIKPVYKFEDQIKKIPDLSDDLLSEILEEEKEEKKVFVPQFN